MIQCRRVGLPVIFMLILCISISLGTASAAVIYAKQDGAASGACDSWIDACDLQYALGLAVPGTDIWVQAGTYKPTTGTDRAISFNLKTGVALYGGFAGNETSLAQRDFETNVTILSGDLLGNDNDNVSSSEPTRADNSYHVVTGNGVDNTAILDGFTITGGNANGASAYNSGGGMYNNSSSPSLNNVTFSGNSAGLGGGMYNNSSPSLNNVTFSRNSALSGGGMTNYVSRPTLTKVIFSANSADGDGGGMYNQGGAPTLKDVIFDSNSAGSNGGGMNNMFFSHPALTTVTFSGNTAGNGGGGMAVGINSSATLTDVTFSGNTAGNGGGGISVYSQTYSSTLINVTFNGNTSKDGGGMAAYFTYSTLINVTFSGNVATNNGGGMYIDCCGSGLENVTLSGNSAGSKGGGMYYGGSDLLRLNYATISGNSANEGGGVYSSSLDVTNSILWGNDGGQIAGGNSSISDSIIQGGCPAGGSCTNVIDQDPQLGVLGNYGGPTETIPLLAGSPAIDAIPVGTNGCGTYVTTDQRGVARPQGEACDMGAYEYGPLYRLTVGKAGNGTVRSDIPGIDCGTACTGNYAQGVVVALTATPAAGWVFDGWSGSCTGRGACTVTMSGARSVKATFTAAPQPIIGRSAMAYEPMAQAIAHQVFGDARPIGIGPYAAGKDRVSVNVGMSAFAEPTDLYLVLRLPGIDPGGYYQLKQDGTFKRASEGPAPWRTGWTGAVDENLFGLISAGTLPSGTYELYMMAAPTGRTDEYRLWETVFDVPYSGVMPLPRDGRHYKQQAAAFPVRSLDPAIANPIGLGSAAVDGKAMGLSAHASMGDKIEVKAGLEGFDGPADIYFGIYIPDLEPNDLFILRHDGAFQRLSQGLVTWKTGQTGPVDEALFGSIPLSSLPGGRYVFYLMATPQGRLDAWYLWESEITVP